MIGKRKDKMHPQPPQSTPEVADFFKRWLSIKIDNVDNHILLICTENNGSIGELIDELREIMRGHYVAPEITSKRIAELGAPETAKLLREHLPTTKEARSGDFGEFLATELAECWLGFSVPIRRLRWKDGRNMALRGDDIVAIAKDRGGRLRFLKGESKSRAKLTSTAVKEAAVALDRDHGRPTRYSVLFVAERLREMEKHELANDLEKAVLQGFNANSIEHLLFITSGNNPDSYLSNHLRECKNKMRRHAVGVHIINHSKFVKRLFSEL